MLPVFLQILQQFTKPQHLILCKLNSVRTAGENACECSWMGSLYSINFCLKPAFSIFPTLKVQRISTVQKNPQTNKTLNKQTEKQTLTPLPQSTNKETKNPQINSKGIYESLWIPVATPSALMKKTAEQKDVF